MAAMMTSLPGGVDYTVVLVPASAAADAGAFPQGSFVLPPGTTLSAPPALPPPPHLGVDPAAGLPYGGLGPLPAGAFGQSTAEDAEAFAAHGLLAPFGPEGADGFYGPLDTAQFAAAAGLLPPEAPQEEPLPLPPQHLLPLIRPPLPRRKPRVKSNYVRDDARFEYVTPSAAELAVRRSFPCAVCGRSTANPQALRRHLTAHGAPGLRVLADADAAAATAAAAAAEAPPREQRFFCPDPQCAHHPGEGGGGPGAHPLKTLRSLRAHHLHEHSGAAPEAAACSRCGRTYRQRNRLRTHEKHCGTRHRCSCGAWYTERRTLVKHLALYPDHADAGAVDALGRDLTTPGEEEEEEDEDEEDGEGDER